MATGKSSLNIKHLGQVFTASDIVAHMLQLRRNWGNTLEPSVGNGAFIAHLESSAVGIEVDQRIIEDERVVEGDFFDYSVDNKFDTIIGNPPYVRYQDIGTETKARLPMGGFDRRSNLYLFYCQV